MRVKGLCIWSDGNCGLIRDVEGLLLQGPEVLVSGSPIIVDSFPAFERRQFMPLELLLQLFPVATQLARVNAALRKLINQWHALLSRSSSFQARAHCQPLALIQIGIAKFAGRDGCDFAGFSPGRIDILGDLSCGAPRTLSSKSVT